MKKLLCLCICLLLALPGGLCAEENAPSALSVFEALQAGEYDAVLAQLDAAMKKAVPRAALAAMLPQLQTLRGAYVGYDQEETAWQQDYRITVLHLRYEKGGFAFQVTWKGDKIAGLFISPEALPTPVVADALPEALTEEDVQIGPYALPGTLTLPREINAPLPAVVLLHGSGPNDRDETAGQTKLFRDLAWGLALRGIAVLRYDKRTLVYGAKIAAGDMRDFTIVQESIEDAVAAGKLLALDHRVDAGRVYLCGHSLGAMIAPRIARENPGVFSGLMLLSGSPRTLADIILSQNQALVNALPAPGRAAQQVQLDALAGEWRDILSGDENASRGKTIFGQSAYYFWEMAQMDTADALNALKIPVLIINGGADFQVTDENGLEAWQSAQLLGDVTLIHYEALNHLLMCPDAPEDARGTLAEYDVCCQAPDFILDDLSEFILK